MKYRIFILFFSLITPSVNHAYSEAAAKALAAINMASENSTAAVVSGRSPAEDALVKRMRAKATDDTALDENPPTLDTKTIASGRQHSCQIEADGNILKCWGNNSYGQLGNGTSISTSMPVIIAIPPLTGSSAKWLQILANGDKTCALVGNIQKSDVFCWGDNSSQIFDYENIATKVIYIPTLVKIPDQVKDFSLGENHWCAISANSVDIYCTGLNNFGQIADEKRSFLVNNKIVVISDATGSRNENWHSIYSGNNHNCALTDKGRIYCWGNNTKGQLGLGDQNSRHMPVILTERHWVNLSLGTEHSCGLQKVKDKRTLFCWGSNVQGQIGDGSDSGSNLTPSQIEAPMQKSWIQVFAGGQQSCAITDKASIYCWGSALKGKTGESNSKKTIKPQLLVPEQIQWSNVTIGSTHACIRSTSGRLSCLGARESGQLADQTDLRTIQQGIFQGLIPENILGLEARMSPISLSTGHHHACAVSQEEKLWCWGDGKMGALGNGKRLVSNIPVQALDPNPALRWDWVVSGINGNCARKYNPNVSAADALYCWGDNASGRLAKLQTDSLPIVEPTLIQIPPTIIPTDGSRHDMWVKAAIGNQHGCAISKDISANSTLPPIYRLYCWGNNTKGQTGIGKANFSYTHTMQKVELEGWTNISAGAEHTCGIKMPNNELFCWGSDESGQVGYSGSNDKLIHDKPVSLGAGWLDVSLGDYYSCGIRSVNNQRLLFCWGDNSSGQLALGKRMDTSVPVQSLLSNLPSLIDSGPKNGCLISQSRVYCWGSGKNGESGRPANINFSTLLPNQIDLDFPAQAIAVGESYSCAVKSNQKISCWGRDYSGERGNGKAFEKIPQPTKP